MLVAWRWLALISLSTVLGGCDLVFQLERPPEAQRFIPISGSRSTRGSFGMTRSTSVRARRGFIGRVITVPNGDLLEDPEVTERGTYSATASQDRAIDWIMQLAAFRGF